MSYYVLQMYEMIKKILLLNPNLKETHSTCALFGELTDLIEVPFLQKMLFKNSLYALSDMWFFHILLCYLFENIFNGVTLS